MRSFDKFIISDNFCCNSLLLKYEKRAILISQRTRVTVLSLSIYIDQYFCINTITFIMFQY